MGTTNTDLMKAFDKAMAEIASLKGDISAMREEASSNGHKNGKGTKSAKPKVAKGTGPWVNTGGYGCESAYGAFWSSRAIVRHLTGDCGCDPDAEYRKKGKTVKGFRCKAVKKYGYTYANRGSQPHAVIPEDVLDAVGKGR